MKIISIIGAACLFFNEPAPVSSLKWSPVQGSVLHQDFFPETGFYQGRFFEIPTNFVHGRSPESSHFTLKAISNSDRLSKYGEQVYGVPTYDALFKWILDDEVVRPSFFNALIPDINVTSSKRLDESMNPIQEYQLLRKFVNKNETLSTVASLKNATGFEVKIKKHNQTRLTQFNKGTKFLKELLDYFGDIVKGFPTENYDGAMDFVCLLDTGDYALIETRVIPQDYWDRRALAYIAAFYGKQIRKGGEWKDIKKVIGINILGGGADNKNPWKDAPGEFLRHYKFQDQLNSKPRFIDGIELYQYSIANVKNNALTEEQAEWLKFLRDAHKMSEAEVEKIKTPAVRRAFDRAKLNTLTQAQLEAYESEDVQYRRITGLIKEERDEAEAEGRAEGLAKGEAKTRREVALKMLSKNKDDSEIMEFCELTQEELDALKK